ncbi:MAG: hypothetical protein ABR545_02215 [Cyclonatronaceae bacterium]
MKRLFITLFIILLILFGLHFSISVIVTKSVETALGILNDEPGRDLTYSRVDTRPYAASVTISDFIYTGTDYPAQISSGELNLKLSHADFFRIVFSPSETTYSKINRYTIEASSFSYQHEENEFSLNAEQADWIQDGSLQDFTNSVFSGILPSGHHRFSLNLQNPELRIGSLSSLPGFTASNGFMITDLITLDAEYTPEDRRFHIRELIAADGNNHAELRGNALLHVSGDSLLPNRVDLEFHLDATTPDFQVMIPGNPGVLNAGTLQATLLTTVDVLNGVMNTDDLVLRFSADRAVIQPSAAMEQQLQPMFRMLGVPFQPFGITRLEGEMLLLDNRLEFAVREAETAFTRFRYNMVTFLNDAEISESPLAGGTFELYDMEPQVVQLLRGLETFMRWQLQWDGHRVYVPVSGTLGRPQLLGITTR